MPNFSTQITVSRSRRRDLGPLRKETLLGMQRLFKVAVGVYLETAARNVKVDSGMTAHTFIEAAREVGKVGVLRAIIHGGKFADRIYKSDRFPGVMSVKKDRHGELLGQRAYTLNLGTLTKPKLFFRFEIVTLQHYLHDDEWESLQKAREAMDAYIRNNASDYVPSVSEFLASGRLISRK